MQEEPSAVALLLVIPAQAGIQPLNAGLCWLGIWDLAFGIWPYAFDSGPRLAAAVGPGFDCEAAKALSKNPGSTANPAHALAPGAQLRGALLFGYFLLGKQEKVTRRRRKPLPLPLPLQLQLQLQLPTSMPMRPQLQWR